MKHMKDVTVQREKEVAEADGLDPNTTKCGVTTQWSNVYLTATAATAAYIYFSKKNF